MEKEHTRSIIKFCYNILVSGSCSVLATFKRISKNLLINKRTGQNNFPLRSIKIISSEL